MCYYCEVIVSGGCFSLKKISCLWLVRDVWQGAARLSLIVLSGSSWQQGTLGKRCPLCLKTHFPAGNRHCSLVAADYSSAIKSTKHIIAGICWHCSMGYFSYLRLLYLENLYHHHYHPPPLPNRGSPVVIIKLWHDGKTESASLHNSWKKKKGIMTLNYSACKCLAKTGLLLIQLKPKSLDWCVSVFHTVQ